MIISALVIVAYTTLGGFLAASTTDFIQSIIMSIALVIVFIFGIHTAGGWGAVAENACSLPGYLTMTTTYNPVTGMEEPYPLLNIFSMIAWGLGYFGMPHILLRFMAIEDEKKLSLSRRVATTWVVISLAVAVLIGVVGLGMTKAGELTLLEGSASETIIVKIADLLSTHGFLHFLPEPFWQVSLLLPCPLLIHSFWLLHLLFPLTFSEDSLRKKKPNPKA